MHVKTRTYFNICLPDELAALWNVILERTGHRKRSWQLREWLIAEADSLGIAVSPLQRQLARHASSRADRLRRESR